MHVCARGRMLETKHPRMQSLTRQDVETVVDELLVAREGGSLQDGVASISRIAEERMSYVTHVRTYLVRASRLKDTLHKGDISKTL